MTSQDHCFATVLSNKKAKPYYSLFMLRQKVSALPKIAKSTNKYNDNLVRNSQPMVQVLGVEFASSVPKNQIYQVLTNL